MRIDILINGDNNPDTNYITWAPTNCQLIMADPEGATDTVRVTLRNQSTNQAGRVIFFYGIPGNGQNELQLDLPINGTPVDFFIAGEFDRSSVADKDTSIEVIDANTGDVLAATSLMVRIRKNANGLTTEERDRFLAAFATLNDRGLGRFSDFRDMHTNAGDPEAHGDSGFLPWHRSYLMDLERELQRIDPSVTLPYWRFDQPAPRLFRQDFIGTSTNTGRVEFAPSNPLVSWVTDLTPGVLRRPLFNTRTEAASRVTNDEAATLALGNGSYWLFRDIMEGDPHGAAHVSFREYISRIHTAAKDPLFFLLHTNVDRLWAKWQWIFRRYDITDTDTYNDNLDRNGNPGQPRVGHRLNDTMWPWNQVTTAQDPNRPATAPGGNFPDSSLVNAPGLTPAVRDMVDYQGVLNPASRLGFDYDDVPFEF